MDASVPGRQKPGQGARSVIDWLERAMPLTCIQQYASPLQVAKTLLDRAGTLLDGVDLGHRLATIGNGDGSSLANMPQNLREAGFGVVGRVNQAHPEL